MKMPGPAASTGRRFRHLLTDELWRPSLLVLVLTSTANGLNYVYQLVMGRLLGPLDFGTMGALLALVMVIGIPLAAAQTGVAHFVAVMGRTSAGRLASMLGSVRRAMVLLGAVLLAASLVGSAWIQGRFGVSRAEVAVVGATVALIPISIFYVGYLQGGRRFRPFGAAPAAGAGTRLVVSASLVLAGMGLFGALLGSLAGMLAILAVGVGASRWNVPLKSGRGQMAMFLAYTGPSALALFGFAALTNMDIVAVKILFSGRDAGIYAGAAVVGKVILFLPTAVGLVLFPLASESMANPREQRRLFLRAVAGTAVLLAPVAVLFGAAPHAVASLVLGSQYVDSASLLRWFAPAMGAMGLLNVVLLYLLATRRMVAAMSLCGFALAELALLAAFHGSLREVVQVVLGIGFATLGFGIVAALVPPRPERKADSGEDQKRQPGNQIAGYEEVPEPLV